MPKPFTEQLRQAIDKSDLSRYAICKRIGIPQSTMSRFMAGDCGLAVETIDKLCELLGVKLTATKRKRGN